MLSSFLTRFVCSSCSPSSFTDWACFCFISFTWASWLRPSSSINFFIIATSCSLLALSKKEAKTYIYYTMFHVNDKKSLMTLWKLQIYIITVALVVLLWCLRNPPVLSSGPTTLLPAPFWTFLTFYKFPAQLQAHLEVLRQARPFPVSFSEHCSSELILFLCWSIYRWSGYNLQWAVNQCLWTVVWVTMYHVWSSWISTSLLACCVLSSAIWVCVSFSCSCTSLYSVSSLRLAFSTSCRLFSSFFIRTAHTHSNGKGFTVFTWGI